MPLSPESDSTEKLVATRSAVSMTIVAIGAALLFFIGYAGVSMNRAAWNTQAALVDNALTELVNRTLMEQKGWAFWDDAARASHQHVLPRAWFDRQFGAPLVEGYGHDQILLIGPDNRMVYGYRRNDKALEPLWPAMVSMIREIRTGEPRAYVSRDRLFGNEQAGYATLPGPRTARWAANVLQDDRGPVIVSMMTIVPSSEIRLAVARPHILVSIVRLDAAAFRTIGRSLRLGELRLVTSGPITDKGMRLRTDDGRPAGAVVWTADQPGRMMLTRVLPIVAILVLIALLYSRRMFRRLEGAHALLRDQEASARFLALHDGLSQLPNRRHFMKALRDRLAVTARNGGGSQVCVAYLDVDRFKQINDAIGHGAGDALVMQIGPRLRALLRPGDMLARLGGDEFAVLREIEDADAMARLGETIMASFKRPFDIGGAQIEVTASAGVALAAPGETDPERVLQQADISLYRAKDAGRNRYALFEAGMDEEVRIRHAVETDLRGAIGTGQIIMHYQPIISTRTGRITSVEALVRWSHPQRGLVPPERFITIAEQSGLMVPLGDHILEQVFREANRFPGVEIAINLSPIQLRQRHLPDRLAQLSRLFNVDPRRIVLEVTETMLVEADEITNSAFAEMRGLGFRTALDDFGTGYSALGYLHRFEFDKIKIDRSFVSSGSVEKVRPIIEGIVHIGRGLRMDIVAEGVETPAELAMIQAMGCTEAQGYLISKPLPIDEAVAFATTPRQPFARPQSLYLAVG